MRLSATSEINVETSGMDVSYGFPPRPLGKLRWFGLFLMAFSVLFVWGPSHSLLDSIRRLPSSEQVGFELFSVVSLGVFVVMGCVPAALGLLGFCGRCRVDWRDQRLSVVEYAGPIRWRRRLPRSPIRKFTVSLGKTNVNDTPITEGPFAELSILTAEFVKGKTRPLVIAYPREWLTALAEDLSARVGASTSTVTAPQVTVVDARQNPPEFAEVNKPANTKVRIEQRPRGALVEIPPAGLWKGIKGLFLFGVIWFLFFTIVGGSVFMTKHRAHEVWPYLMIALFWLIGVATILGAINMGRRRATLIVESGRLALTQTGIWGTKHRMWERGEIAAIRADKSGMEMNDRPVIELQIHPVAGKKAGFFGGRDDDELRWIATELRQALDVPASSDSSAVARRAQEAP